MLNWVKKPPPSLRGEFEERRGLDFLSSDWRKISTAADILFNEIFYGMKDTERPAAFFGLSAGELKKLYTKLEAEALRTDRLWDVRESLKNLSNNEIAAVMHVENIRGMIKIAAHVMAERNQQNGYHEAERFDRTARQDKLIANIGLMKNYGYDVQDMEELLTNIKFWPTFTPHPTKDKNDAGEAFFRRLVSIAESVPSGQRIESIREVIEQMIRTRLTPEKKDTLQKETQDGLSAEDVYVESMLDYLEDMQLALDTVYGEKSVNLADINMSMDIAPRDWFTGDADGKYVPAPILFAKRVRSAHKAISRYLQDLGSTKNKEKLKDIVAVFTELSDKFSALNAKMDMLEKRYLTNGPDKRCWEDQDFLTMREEFGQIFTTTSYKGKYSERGPELTAEIMADLSRIAEDENLDSDTRNASRRVILRHRHTGIAMGRQEVRHNADDYRIIFDNLYQYLRDNSPEVLTKAGLENMVKLTKLDDESEAVLLKRLMESHTGEIKQWLLAANPEGWPRDILERFNTLHSCFNHNRTGAAIIAEAKPISPVHQQVMAEAFGIRNMVHMALNEDERTIRKVADSLQLYNKIFGQQNLESRIEKILDENRRPHYALYVMFPQSDSQKQYGQAIKNAQRKAEEDLIEFSLQFNVAACGKKGTGLASTRGGDSPKAVPRYMLHIMTGLRSFKKADPRLLKQIVSFVSTTIQGRDVGVRLGTQGQCYDMISGVVEEIMGACMVIDRKIRPEIVVPPPTKYSWPMQKILDQIEGSARNEYIKMRSKRFSKYALGETRLDTYMRDVASLVMAEKQGVGARQSTRGEAKGDSKKISKKDVTGLRAIGTTNAIESAENRFDGHYTLGRMLKKLHEAYHKREISRSDLINFRQDAFYLRHRFPNSFATLAAADYEHGYDQLSNGKEPWTVGDILAAEREEFATLKRNAENDNGNGYDSKKKRKAESKAFHTELAHDAIMATAFMEALQETDSSLQQLSRALGKKKGFDLSYEEIIGRIYSKQDRVNRLKFGKKTKSLIPDLEDISAHNRDKLLVRAAQHEMERRIDLSAGDPSDPKAIDPSAAENQGLLHHVACARRTQGPINLEVALDHNGFGSRDIPLFDIIRQHAPPPAPSLEYASVAR